MALFILFFSIAIGLLCFWASIKMLRTYFRVKKWEKISAKVVSKKIEIHEKYSTSRSPYGVKAEYVYYFKGKQYEGNTVYLAELLKGQVNHMERTAQNKLKEISDKMTVFVNPQKPEESVMFCEGAGMYYFIFLMGLISILIGLGYFWIK